MSDTRRVKLETSHFGYSHDFLSQKKWWGQILANLTFKIPNQHISANRVQQKFSLGLGAVPTPNLAVYSQVSIKRAAPLSTYICQVSKCLSPDKMWVFFDPNMY